MSGTVAEWIDKSETDYRVAERELMVDGLTDYGPVCFHAQQCVEKLMKARIIAAGIVPPYSHDLARLSRLLQTVEPSWDWQEVELLDLTDAATDARYPGNIATQEDARQMFGLCTRIRETLRRLLPPRA